MTAALVLVDLQEDYFARPGLVPPRDLIIEGVARELDRFRAAALPIVHARTVVASDGSDAMPHWAGGLMCVEGTPGAAPPVELVERAGEFVAVKQFYSAFADARLDPWLRSRGVTTLVVVGLYSHACVRETAIAAYERGFEVVIAREAVGTDSPEHERQSFAWLEGRAAAVLDSSEVAELVDRASSAPGFDRVDAAVAEAARAQSAWAARSIDDRRVLLDAWAVELEARTDLLADSITAEVFKPSAMARDEAMRAVAHVRTAASLPVGAFASRQVAASVEVVAAPLGVVGIIMPWNNPAALPIGKIAPALIAGNAVVFKPAPEAEGTARLIIDALAAAGVPRGLVQLVSGGPDLGRAVVAHRGIDGIAVTGSIATGRAIAESCARTGTALQAELGGNNAAIVDASVDRDEVARSLVSNAFAFAGQRCTAIRRAVILESELSAVVDRIVARLDELVLGDPADPATSVGPVISERAAARIARAIDEARASGADVLRGGGTFQRDGRWYVEPTVIVARDRASAIVRTETFGPVLVIQPAATIDEAIELANDVEQGLVMAVCSNDEDVVARVERSARVGIVQRGAGPLPVHPDAPFGGWKASGFGPPEHGEWDLQFFLRAQSRYR